MCISQGCFINKSTAALLYRMFFSYCIFITIFTATVFSQEVPSYYFGNRGTASDSQSRYVYTSSDRRRPQPDDYYSPGRNSRNNDQFNSDSSDGSQFPDYFRIEVEVQNLDNPSGLLANGQNCDTLNACDPRVSVYMDISQPRSPWPGPVPISKWKTIFDGTNRNSANIGKVVIRDVCGGGLGGINLRAKIVDADDTSGDDIIGQFECAYDNLTPDDVAPTLMSASWSRSTQCFSVSKNQPSSIRLTTRMRMYTIPRSSCRADAPR
ncbi:uncharacterized protein LOC129580985 [Paramacrobiotus metropolitanus]|uniref:uncharacterized protein LOC129580985 n=1 Tax=Paramacrobiotus metropolitanus TaxID=2943436 RepID=UPI00244570CF|nr:uncharacterized protein LOC129580985 [Paramacrobiotus metropolitanus]